jgi:hypothetical protein
MRQIRGARGWTAGQRCNDVWMPLMGGGDTAGVRDGWEEETVVDCMPSSGETARGPWRARACRWEEEWEVRSTKWPGSQISAGAVPLG